MGRGWRGGGGEKEGSLRGGTEEDDGVAEQGVDAAFVADADEGEGEETGGVEEWMEEAGSVGES